MQKFTKEVADEEEQENREECGRIVQCKWTEYGFWFRHRWKYLQKLRMHSGLSYGYKTRIQINPNYT